MTNVGGGRWSWTFGTNDGPTQSRTVSITATDDKGEGVGVDFALVVNNVAPSVIIDPGQLTTTTEGAAFNIKATFDRQALTPWLNFADGSLDLDSPVDTNLDLRMDSTFGAVMANAETVRLNPVSTNAQIRQQTLLLERINTLGF